MNKRFSWTNFFIGILIGFGLMTLFMNACSAQVTAVPPAATYPAVGLHINWRDTHWGDPASMFPDVMRVYDNRGNVQMRLKMDGGIVLRNGASLDLDGIYFPKHPDFAGYARIRVNGVDVYTPVYFDLAPDQQPIGPEGPHRP